PDRGTPRRPRPRRSGGGFDGLQAFVTQLRRQDPVRPVELWCEDEGAAGAHAGGPACLGLERAPAHPERTAPLPVVVRLRLRPTGYGPELVFVLAEGQRRGAGRRVGGGLPLGRPPVE